MINTLLTGTNMLDQIVEVDGLRRKRPSFEEVLMVYRYYLKRDSEVGYLNVLYTSALMRNMKM